MPNHVTTILTAPKEVLDSLYKDEYVDFGTVIPMPDEDDPIFTAERTDYGGGMVGYSLGGFSPMDWARAHWGTKWNAYDTERRAEDQLKFETAWSHPDPVIIALSEKFPEAEIHVRYADEDLGSNFGEYFLLNGEITQSTEFESEEAELDFASQILYGKSYAVVKAEWDEDDARWEAQQELKQITTGTTEE